LELPAYHAFSTISLPLPKAYLTIYPPASLFQHLPATAAFLPTCQSPNHFLGQARIPAVCRLLAGQPAFFILSPTSPFSATSRHRVIFDHFLAGKCFSGMPGRDYAYGVARLIYVLNVFVPAK
jgi:hypothetical protein